MFFTEISFYLNGDKHTIIDIINPSMLFVKEDEAHKEGAEHIDGKGAPWKAGTEPELHSFCHQEGV